MLTGICNKCACTVAPHASICGGCAAALSNDELLKHLTAETKASAGAQLPMVLDPTVAMSLVGLLHLALRHPGTKGRPTAAIAENFIAGVQSMFAELQLPAHVETINRGGKPQHDVIDGKAEKAEAST